ncbi:MAG: hypothetical protein AAFP86_03300 [Planctomycetota bacterium]
MAPAQPGIGRAPGDRERGGAPHRRPARGGLGFAARLGAVALLAFLQAACAATDSERNLSPLYSSHSAAGDVPEVEALGGAVLARQHPVTGERSYWAIRPLVSNRYAENGDRFAWFLPPLGFVDDRVSEGRNVAQFVPLVRYATERLASGFVEWSLLVLPGLYVSAHEDGRVQRAFFPFYGYVERFFGADRARFLLFPLWLRVERYGRKTDHFLWPLFTYARGAGGTSWRAWPVVGNPRWEGRYDRWFVAWPFVQWQTNDIQFGEDETQRSWFVWPILGRARRGPASETTALWPFFGYTTDPESGFWAWDGPWFLVRFQGGSDERPVRKRVLPFYSYYQGQGLTSRWFAWPLVNARSEEYVDGTRESLNVFPFWRSFDRHREVVKLGTVAVQPEDGPAGTERYRKVWPFGKTRTAPDERDFTLVDLNPFQELDFLNEHYAWLWELYTSRARGEELRQRTWLGLWRRERDADEDRRSLAFLWSARDYTRAGRRASERSWLFGLLRYRTVEGEGTSLLRPALPGPGWPMRRTPNSGPPSIDAPPGG